MFLLSFFSSACRRHRQRVVFNVPTVRHASHHFGDVIQRVNLFAMLAVSITSYTMSNVPSPWKRMWSRLGNESQKVWLTEFRRSNQNKEREINIKIRRARHGKECCVLCVSADDLTMCSVCVCVVTNLLHQKTFPFLKTDTHDANYCWRDMTGRRTRDEGSGRGWWWWWVDKGLGGISRTRDMDGGQTWDKRHRKEKEEDEGRGELLLVLRWYDYRLIVASQNVRGLNMRGDNWDGGCVEGETWDKQTYGERYKASNHCCMAVVKIFPFDASVDVNVCDCESYFMCRFFDFRLNLF